MLGGSLIFGGGARSRPAPNFYTRAAHRRGLGCVEDRCLVVAGTDLAGCWRAACTVAVFGLRDADHRSQSPEAD